MSPFNRIFKLLIFIILGWVQTGCLSSRVIKPSNINLTPDFCVLRQKTVPVGNRFIYPNTDSLMAHDSTMIRNLSKTDILIANASGSIDLTHTLLVPLQDSARMKKYLTVSTAIETNIALLRSEVDDVSAELECEIIRCRQLSSYLANLNSKRNTKLTVGAIIVASATTIMPIFIKQTSAQNIVLISGGVISAGLSLLTLNPRGRQIKLVTPNNMLSDIWFGNKTSLVYPLSVWYILNEPGFSNAGLVSKRVLIRTRWLNFELGSAPDVHTEELLFGSGGIFDQASLETRATMLTQVMAHVNSIKKDLDNFSYALNKLKLKLIQQYDW